MRANPRASELVQSGGSVKVSPISGQETKVPAPESLNFWRGPAEKGDARAQFNLGVIKAGVPRDNAEATRWSRKAVGQGDAAAHMVKQLLA